MARKIQNTATMDDLRQRIIDIKVRLGLTQKQIAARIGYCNTSLSIWMQGKHTCKRRDNIIAALDRLEEEYNAKTRH